MYFNSGHQWKRNCLWLWILLFFPAVCTIWKILKPSLLILSKIKFPNTEPYTIIYTQEIIKIEQNHRYFGEGKFFCFFFLKHVLIAKRGRHANYASPCQEKNLEPHQSSTFQVRNALRLLERAEQSPLVPSIISRSHIPTGSSEFQQQQRRCLSATTAPKPRRTWANWSKIHLKPWEAYFVHVKHKKHSQPPCTCSVCVALIQSFCPRPWPGELRSIFMHSHPH